MRLLRQLCHARFWAPTALALALICSIGRAGPSSTPSPPILENGGFEEGLAGWANTGGASLDATIVHSGSAALLLSDGQVRQTAAAPGDAFFRLDVHYITAAGTPSIGLAWLDEAGVQITMRTLALASAGPGYTPFTIAGVSPSRARAVEVMFLAPPGAILHVDDVSLDMGESVAIDDPAPPTTSEPGEAEPAAPGPEPPSEREPSLPSERPPGPSPEVNALYNGSFREVEGGLPAGWTAFRSSVVSADPAAGEVSLTTDALAINWLAQTVRLDGEGGFEVAAEVEGPGALRVSWHATDDGSGSALGLVESEAAAGAEASTGPFAVPSNARSLRVRLVVEGEPGTAATFRDVVLRSAEVPIEEDGGTSEEERPDAAESRADNAEDGEREGRATPSSTASSRRAAASRVDASVPRVQPQPAAGRATVRASSSGTSGRPASSAPRPDSPEVTNARLLVNEVAFDAVGVRWVELYNASSEPLSLEGWTLTGPEGRIALPDVTLAAQGFTVGGSGEGFLAPFPDFAGLVAFVTTLEWGDALAREGGWIELADPQGVLVDGVSWGTDASILSVAPAALQASHSMERLPAGLDRDVADDFVENTAPTPGRGLSTTHADDSASIEEAAAWTGALFAALAGLAAGAYALARHPKAASPDKGKDSNKTV